AQDYQELLADLRAAVGEPDLRKLRKRFEEIRRIDFFDAPGKDEVLALMTSRENKPVPPSTQFSARRWVTRRGIKIDRTACCWLIRRFIDPAAVFVFVDPNHHTHIE